MEEKIPEQNPAGKYILIIFFLALILVGVGAAIFSGIKSANKALPTPTPSDNITGAASGIGVNSSPPAEQSIVMNNSTDLQIIDETLGTGEEAVAGKKVTVNYLGTLTDGTKFDSSYDRGTPFSFVLGAGEVIKGWDDGVAGMKVGGKRKLTIPSSMAYGDNGIPGAIPGGATLIFEVELLGVE